MLVNMTGGKKVQNIINEIIEPVLLWTNPSPSSAFRAQTIAVDGADYDAYLVKCKKSTGNATVVGCGYIYKNAGFSPQAVCVGQASVTGNIAGRKVTSADDNSVVFGDASGYNASASEYIPTHIWGVKYTL